MLWVMLLASTQVYASCSYSPPPVLSHGQGADTLGTSHWAVAAEAGWGTNASWWTASNLGHPEVKSGWIGVSRLRYGLGDGYSYALEEVGHIFKVTRERIRQIEAKAVRKLQQPCRSARI